MCLIRRPKGPRFHQKSGPKALSRLFGGLRHGEALGDERVRQGIEGHSDVSSRNLKIDFRIPGYAIAPVHEAIVAGVDGGLQYRLWNSAPQRVDEIAGASAGVA